MACRLARAATGGGSLYGSRSCFASGLSSSAHNWGQLVAHQKSWVSYPVKMSLRFCPKSQLVGQTRFIQSGASPGPDPLSEASTGTPDDNPMVWPSRSHGCGTLGEADVGVRVRVCGWVASQRSHGGVAFVNVRDHSGIVQVLGPGRSLPPPRNYTCTCTCLNSGPSWLFLDSR